MNEMLSVTMDSISKQNENGLDQFYTNKDIALKCYNKLTELINLKVGENKKKLKVVSK